MRLGAQLAGGLYAFELCASLVHELDNYAALHHHGGAEAAYVHSTVLHRSTSCWLARQEL